MQSGQLLGACLCILPMIGHANGEVVPSSGTLVLILPVRNGLVACADRREWNSIEGPKDNVQKIHLLGETAAFAVSGVNGILAPTSSGHLQEVYSLTESIHAFYTDRDVKNLGRYWEEISSALHEGFESAHKRWQLPIQAPPGARDDVVWEVLFIYARDKVAALKKITYRLGDETTVSNLPKRPYVTGQVDVVLRILRPQQYSDGHLFSDLRGNPQIARAWNFSAPGYPEGVNLQDALILARTFIRASSERMHLVTRDPVLVGPTFDCVLLREDSETVEWLETGP